MLGRKVRIYIAIVANSVPLGTTLISLQKPKKHIEAVYWPYIIHEKVCNYNSNELIHFWKNYHQRLLVISFAVPAKEVHEFSEDNYCFALLQLFDVPLDPPLPVRCTQDTTLIIL